jgi:hypothetical protein
MITLLSFVFRIVLLAVFVFLFVVLLEHGTADFPAGAAEEFSALRGFVAGLVNSGPSAAAAPTGP